MQYLLQRVTVTPADDLTAAYPARTSTRVHITLNDGRTFEREQSDFEGSPSRPMSWERVVDRFHWLGEPFADDTLRSEIVSAVEGLDGIRIAELTGLLGAVSPTPKRGRSRGRL